MRRILIDTNIYAAFKRNDPLVVEILRTVDYIGMSVIVLGELYSGFKGGDRERKNRVELERFLDSSRVEILPVDDEVAEYYSKIYWLLKGKGKPIPTNDIWIAATAIKNGLFLLSYDDHFKEIENLYLYNWR